MNYRVSVVKCENYEQDEVYSAVRKSLEHLGGIQCFIQPGQRVLIKPNLLMRKKPEEATTTHPFVVAALAKILMEAGAIVLIADSPGGPFNALNVKGVYRACGMLKVAEETGACLNEDYGETTVSYPEGLILKRFTVCNFLTEIDKVISVAKLKTHGMTTYSGAVKNLFGVIPGLYKAEYHLKMPEIKDFTNMLIDVCEYVHPTLSFIDGVIGMEGKGPSAGDPRKVGYIFASTNPHAVDFVGAWTMGIAPLNVPTIARAVERRLSPTDLGQIEILGDRLIQIKDYNVPKHRTVSFIRGRMPKKFEKFILAYLQPKPVFLHEQCVGCRDCMKYCPPNRPVD